MKKLINKHKKLVGAMLVAPFCWRLFQNDLCSHPSFLFDIMAMFCLGVASFWFGYSLTRDYAVGITTGASNSFSIEAAGGWSAAAAAGNVSLAGVGTGVGSAAIGGYLVGTLLYNNSETVRDAAQWTVGAVLDTVDTAVAVRDWAAGVTAPYVIRYMVP